MADSPASVFNDPIYFDFELQCPLAWIEPFFVNPNGRRYPVFNKVPRFVDPSNYADDFGFQWNHFAKTQLDSYTGLAISEDRLKAAFGPLFKDLPGSRLLEAGSGAGRFTEILLKHGAIVHSFDFSSAVDANFHNNGKHPNLAIAQADIRAMPYRQCFYDFVVCLGVLQHTPNPEESISRLWEMVRPGGHLIFDHYKWSWKVYLPPPVGQALGLYRLLILLLPRKFRFSVVKRLVDFWFPFQWIFRESKILTGVLRRLTPVILHYNYLKLSSRRDYYEWALLDTHDSLTDRYKHYRTKAAICDALKSLHPDALQVFEGDNGLVVRATKQTSPPC
jgi:SAM-dependent methyltransferase